MSDSASSRPTGIPLTAPLAWAAFVIYGSLVPLEFRPRPDAWEQFLAIPYLDLGVASRADWVANILLYLVLAYLAAGSACSSRLGRAQRILALVATTAACLAMALAIEFAQLFFPPRTVSLNDLVAEFIGTVLGILAWFLAGARLGALWRHFTTGSHLRLGAFLALYVVGYVGISLFPYDFLISVAELQEKLGRSGTLGIVPALACTNTVACTLRVTGEAIMAMPLGALAVTLAATNVHARLGVAAARGLVWGAVAGLLIEGLQILLASGVSSVGSVLTRAIGAAWGAALAYSMRHGLPAIPPAWIRRLVLFSAPVYIILLLAANGLLPPHFEPVWAARERLAELRFLPFYYHYYTTETAAVRSLLTVAGSYAPIGVLTALSSLTTAKSRGWRAALLGALACLAIESLKLFEGEKRPDPTNLIIAAVSAWMLYRLMRHLLGNALNRATVAQTRTSQPVAPLARTMRPAIGAALASLALLTGLAAFVTTPQPGPTTRVALPTFPPPSAQPPLRLEGFRREHPRLPHPSKQEQQFLAAVNPAYLQHHLERARGGSGEPESVILAAYLAPGTMDLTPLLQGLLALQFTDRGDAPVKRLAQAYDWLHAYWNPVERVALQDKLAEGCSYVIDFIRKERLSPYNVILYNSPLQALMACAIALHEDHPQGERFMAFTYDLWKNRVLPVWRQVFGRNGGWHEGGEYLAVGLGQAVYTLPAMWREATGEDLFATEPGLRGFLDFLIHRTRPDGTQFRWGDLTNLQRHPPDAIPLALHFRHPAYALAPPAGPPAPTAWPWGPLSDDALASATAIERLPLSRHFDGIGMVVARSAWTPDATFVSFKAGDNFWSHSHLDQGAFTIFKAAPLAIDSGIYGPRYGSDHHMNYTYQTIAHNTITVTDPTDGGTYPSPEGPKPIANDGGQRRIGSGWGFAPAPLDREEWEHNRERYHTGRIEQYLDANGLTIALADLTPAYTNADSGKFEADASNRTRRVERAWRVFGYDREDDVVVIYDDVRATRSEFRKRWLLHTVGEPKLETGWFAVESPAQPGTGRQGGQLQARILQPQEAQVLSIGGPGFEFFIDGQNFDERGALAAAMRRPPPAPEAGNWRVEILPQRQQEADQFLVVLLPSPAGRTAPHRIRPLSRGNEIGCEIVGPTRITRWWFTPGTLGARIEVERAGQRATYALGAQAPRQ